MSGPDDTHAAVPAATAAQNFRGFEDVLKLPVARKRTGWIVGLSIAVALLAIGVVGVSIEAHDVDAAPDSRATLQH